MTLKTSLTYDLHRQFRPVVWSGLYILDFAKSQHAIDDLAEYDVLAIEPAGHDRGNEL